jgi:hypothetical protein
VGSSPAASTMELLALPSAGMVAAVAVVVVRLQPSTSVTCRWSLGRDRTNPRKPSRRVRWWELPVRHCHRWIVRNSHHEWCTRRAAKLGPRTHSDCYEPMVDFRHQLRQRRGRSRCKPTWAIRRAGASHNPVPRRATLHGRDGYHQRDLHCPYILDHR